MRPVSVIIPAYNAESHLGSTLDSVLSNESVLDVIVVDDCSTDQTAAIANSYAERTGRVSLHRSEKNGGAGHSRNVGMSYARGDYLYFLDSDDILARGAIDEAAAAMSQTGCDVMAFRYTHLYEENGPPAPMLGTDENTWQAVCGFAQMRVMTLDEAPRLLHTVNFPWNKLVNADLCRRTGLFFSTTRVHNDVYAHWHIYMNARKIGLLNKPLIQHRVIRSRSQLSNALDGRRLDVFQAIDDVETRLFSTPEFRYKYYFWFLLFKIDVLTWIANAIDRQFLSEFMRLAEECYRSYSDADYLRIYGINKEVALLTLKLKINPEAVLLRQHQAQKQDDAGPLQLRSA